MAASDYISDRGKLMYERLKDTFLVYEDITSKFPVLGKIGEGGFGSVFEVCNKASGERGAMKKLPYDPQGKQNVNLVREIKTIVHLKPHPNIVRLLDVFKGQTDHIYINMELCSSDLHGFIKIQSNRSEVKYLNIAQQVANGLDFLHSHCTPTIIHSDIKPQNILICHETDSNTIMAKLADFGISSTGEVNEILQQGRHMNRSPSVSSTKTTTGHGTLPFMAPEFFAGRDDVGLVDGKFVFDASVDIFALGLSFLKLYDRVQL